MLPIPVDPFAEGEGVPAMADGEVREEKLALAGPVRVKKLPFWTWETIGPKIEYRSLKERSFGDN